MHPDEVFPLKAKVNLIPKIARIDPERPEYHRTILIQDRSTF